MNIKTAETGDFDRVVEFYDNIIDDMQGLQYHPLWQKRIYPTLEFIRQSIENRQLFIQLENGDIIGCMVINHYGNGYDTVKWAVNAQTNEVDIIHALGVKVAQQGHSYASELVKKAIEMARTNNRKAIRLDVLEPNLPAHELYKKHGFQLREVKDLYYEDTGWTKFMLYELVLDDSDKNISLGKDYTYIW